MQQAPTATILIVDDEVGIREVLRIQLLDLASSIVEAVDGQEALDLLLGGARFDAIVSDIRMPRMSGLEFFEKAKDLSPQTPVVFLTGFGDKVNIVAALRLGAFDFLEKVDDGLKIASVMRRAIDYGRELRLLEATLDRILEESALLGLDAEAVRSAYRGVLKMRTNNKFFLKKSS